MGSPGDNLGRYISFSSEGSWIDPLQFRIPRLVGYPLMDYVAQDISIIAFLELIVKYVINNTEIILDTRAVLNHTIIF